ncbi:hypothetical protein PM082_023972 [Marasmius tenuissimus]|nr:hypothetical protein PM082_023972 [Marasmius tenuissimus]
MFFEILVLLCTLLVVYGLRVYSEYCRVRDSVKDIVSFTTFLPNESDLSSLFSSNTSFVLGQFNFWHRKYDLYERSGWNISAAISLWPRVAVTYIIAEPQIMKEIGLNRLKYPKPHLQYEILNLYGRNIITAEGDEWKKIKKIAAPSFSERNNRMVWDESVLMMTQFFDEIWDTGDEGKEDVVVVVDNFVGPCLQFGLRVIAAAGFGKRLSWTNHHTHTPAESNHALSFEETFQILSRDLYLKLLTPEWIPSITESLGRVRVAFLEMKMYMQEIIEQRSGGREGHGGEVIERDDLFSNLIKANEGFGYAGETLSDDELMGNVFAFLLAGHETSSHTLCFTMALLALYQEEQEKLYQHITGICPDRTPTYDDMPALTRSLAVLYETLRLFPAVIGIPKVTTEDTSFTLTNTHDQGRSRTIPVPAGTQLVIHPPGVHYNPRYWQDPHEFRPDRFLKSSEEWDRDAFVPFSVGARSCIGRRFSEIENVAMLTLLVKTYKFTVTEEDEFKYETFEERKKRVLNAIHGITITPVRVPLTFTKRQ